MQVLKGNLFIGLWENLCHLLDYDMVAVRYQLKSDFFTYNYYYMPFYP